MRRQTAGSTWRDALCHFVCIDPCQYRQIALSPSLPRFLLERKKLLITRGWKPIHEHSNQYRLQLQGGPPIRRSEEHTSELQSLMRISYTVFCLKKKTTN